MDPLSTLSLVSSTLQITDFLFRLVAGTVAIHRSGSLTDHNVTEIIATKLEAFSTDIHKSISCHTYADQQAKDLAHACQNVTRELIHVLGTLKRRKPTVWESFRVALKTVLKKNEVDRLCSDIFHLQASLTTYLQSCVMSQQSQILALLHAINQKFKKWDMPIEETLHGMLKDILGGVRSLSDNVCAATTTELLRPPEASSDNRLFLEGLSQEIKRMSGVLNGFVTKTSAIRNEQVFLESLFFADMLDRQEAVAISHKDTSTWIFSQNKRHSTAQSDWIFRSLGFVDWLQRKSVTFWIYGKPGSGKSTLMKFIVGHERTKRHLQEWAGSQRLVMASHFFWASGSKLQRSQEGLLRTLLFGILRICPELIPIALGSITGSWEGQHAWKGRDLVAMIKALASANFSARFALFIDGLDEYEGQQDQLVAFLQELAVCPDIKVCVSSRPYTRFFDAFGNNQELSLKLEDLTEDDIRKFVHDTFYSNEIFNRHVSDPRYIRLVEEVVRRADGVFLWVFLVCKSLLDGLSYADRVVDLERRLSHVHPDLQGFFEQIMLSADPLYQQATSRTFLMALCAPEPLPLLAYSIADNIQESPEAVRGSCPPSAFSIQVDQMTRRLDGRTKGLLEVRYQGPGLKGMQVEFLHRSVRDFLQTQQIRVHLQNLAGEDFDPNLLLSEVFVVMAQCSDLREYSINNIVFHAGHVERDYGTFPRCMKRLQGMEKSLLFLKAVRAGLCFYVSYALYQEPWLIQTGAFRGLFLGSQPLLDVCLNESHPSQAMAQLLLSYGADVEEEYGGTTIWGAFLDWVVMGGVDMEDSFLYSEVKEVLALMLSCGAPLGYRLNSGQTAGTAIKRYFDPCDAAYLMSKAVCPGDEGIHLSRPIY